MNCLNRYQKSSLRAYNTEEQILTSGSNIVFSTVGYQSGISIKFNAGDSTVYLKSPGLYLVSLDAIISSSTASSDISVQMYGNGSAITGALTESEITAANDFQPGSVTAIIPVGNTCSCPCMAGYPITFTVTGTTPLIEGANLNIVKLA